MLMESAAVEPVPPPPAPVTRSAATFEQLRELVPQLRDRAKAAVQDYPRSQRLDVFGAILERAEALWGAAQDQAADSQGSALALAWDAVACYLAPVLWPSEMVFIPPPPPETVDRSPGFFIDAKPVSSDAFAAFANQEEGWRWPQDLQGLAPGDWPMVHVAYFDALAYLASQNPPQRLPSSRQWERAFRVMREDQRVMPLTAAPPSITEDESEGEDTEGGELPTRRAYPWLHYPENPFSEWTATLSDGTPVSRPGAPTFGDELLTRSAYWTATGKFAFESPQALGYGQSRPNIGFRGVREVPRTLRELKASL